MGYEETGERWYETVADVVRAVVAVAVVVTILWVVGGAVFTGLSGGAPGYECGECQEEAVLDEEVRR